MSGSEKTIIDSKNLKDHEEDIYDNIYKSFEAFGYVEPEVFLAKSEDPIHEGMITKIYISLNLYHGVSYEMLDRVFNNLSEAFDFIPHVVIGNFPGDSESDSTMHVCREFYILDDGRLSFSDIALRPSDMSVDVAGADSAGGGGGGDAGGGEGGGSGEPSGAGGEGGDNVTTAHGADAAAGGDITRGGSRFTGVYDGESDDGAGDAGRPTRDIVLNPQEHDAFLGAVDSFWLKH